MRPPVAHINLLQRGAPAHTVVWALAAVLLVTLIGAGVHGNQLRAKAQEAVRRRDEVAQQLKQVQARLAINNDEKAKSATALALRQEVDALQPQALAAQALLDAVRNAEGGRTEEFARPLAAMTGLSEPGLWLTAMTVSAGGKKLELRGEARSGASVLRFARRANESLKPLMLRMDGLELQPAADGGAVSFHLY